MVSDELLNLLRERFVSDFSACFPVGCGTSADSGQAEISVEEAQELNRSP